MKVYTDASKTVLCFVCPEKQKTVIERHFYKTTNEAEYGAVLLALRHLKGDLEIVVDSQLVANQFNKLYKVRSPRMEMMLANLRSHCLRRKVTITWVERELNMAGRRIEKYEATGGNGWKN